MHAADVIALLEDDLVPLSVRANRAWWSVNVEATPEAERERIDAELALGDFLSAPRLLEAIDEARASSGGDELLARRLELLRNWAMPHQVADELRREIVELEASVESDYATHRGAVGGVGLDDNALRRILRSSDEVAERREAWEASKTIGSVVAGRVRELARLRNRAATSLGFRDWFALAVSAMEMDEERLFATLDETDRVTREPFARWKAGLDRLVADRFGVREDELRPWHYDDPFFQDVPVTGAVDLDPVFAGRDPVELAGRTFDGLGLPVDAILGRSDLFPREGKSQHAFCMDVDRRGDIRVLANVVDNAYWTETMLHELGHAVHNAGYDPSLPWLLRDSHLTITEGVAILMGRTCQDPEWLSGVVGLNGQSGALAASLRAYRAAELLVFTRWVLVMTSFERALYADPEADLDAIWWDLVERHQLVRRPDGRSAPDWAAKIHVACAPVYYHTYLYGHLVASQVQEMLVREAGGIVGRPGAGRLLVERVFAPGDSLRWDRLVERATGAPLSARAFAAQIAAGL